MTATIMSFLLDVSSVLRKINLIIEFPKEAGETIKRKVYNTEISAWHLHPLKFELRAGKLAGKKAKPMFALEFLNSSEIGWRGQRSIVSDHR